MSKIITFDVGTNFDDALFKVVKEKDKEHRIKTFYGKLKNDGLPGGRASSMIPDFTMDQLEEYVKKCHDNGITFNYLINPLCMGQMETDPKQAPVLRKIIHDIYDIGVRQFTVNSPLLVKYLKDTFCDVWVTLGLFAYPVTLQQVQMWINWGVDEVTLDHSFNRDFKLLEKTLRMYKDSNVALRLIANNLCLKECTFRLAHGAFSSHNDASGFVLDYSMTNCAYKKITQPTYFLTSEWIRPEDIHYYEELCEKTGNRNFSLKLVDRTRSTEFISRTMEAYLDERFDGNLLDILNWHEKSKMADIEARKSMKIKNMEYMNMPVMGLWGRVMCFPDIIIDNRKLDGFIDDFVKGSSCKDKLCQGSILEEGSKVEGSCAHCSAWARKAVTGNAQEIAEWKQVAETLFKTLQNGDFAKPLGAPPTGMPPYGMAPPTGMPPFGATPPAGMPPFEK